MKNSLIAKKHRKNKESINGAKVEPKIKKWAIVELNIRYNR